MIDELHGIHPYPCKFPGAMVRPHLAGGGGTLLDPFCGSGTALVEGARAGWHTVLGFDSNPIAVLISRFNLLSPAPALIADCAAVLESIDVRAIRHNQTDTLAFAGAHHWFDAHVRRELSAIRRFIDEQRDPAVTLWLQIALSRIVNRVGRQESETRYVAVDRPVEQGETALRFLESCAAMLDALQTRPVLPASAQAGRCDVRAGLPLKDDSVDRIVTSPPYANTMDYYLYHKQRMNVLGFDFKTAQRAEIGSRHEFSSLKAAASKWDGDYAAVMAECRRVLKPGGYAIFIIGDSQIAGELIDASDLTVLIGREAGLSCTVLDSIALSGRSRSFSRGFQRPNKREHTIRLEKRAAAFSGTAAT